MNTLLNYMFSKIAFHNLEMLLLFFWKSLICGESFSLNSLKWQLIKMIYIWTIGRLMGHFEHHGFLLMGR